MRTTRRGGLVVLLLVGLLSGLLAGCSHGHDRDQSLLGDGSAAPVTAEEAQQVLDARAAAVLKGNRKAFLATIDQADHRLVARQQRWFDNLRQLPVQTLAYRVLKSDWPDGLRARSWGADVTVPQVEVSLRLAEFDDEAVRRVTGFALARRAGHPVVVSELTGAGKPFPASSPAPWDLVRVQVRRTAHTLEVYDDRTWPQSSRLGSTVERGIAEVRQALPFPWEGKVVVYVFARKVVLDSFEGVPGGNIDHLGAMTFPVYAVVGQPAVAGHRLILLPSSLDAGQAFLARITRHELTHVALGDRDDGVPVWLAEGIAEYVAARDIPQDERRIATVAVRRARGSVTGMPPSVAFNGADQAWHYALAWMACDWIAATQGEARLWDLVDAMHNGGAGTPDEAQDAVLQTVLGLDSAQLARRAANRILRIYG